jgi:predicted AlkP superfamily pyrophosphatase or phosphodiesterase
VNAALRQVDAAVGALVAGLKARHLYDRTNIVIVSDHGMTDTPPDQRTVMDELVPPADGVVRTYGATSGVDPLPGHADAVAKILLAPHEYFTCWRKAEIPALWNQSAHPGLCLPEPAGLALRHRRRHRPEEEAESGQSRL